MTGSGLFPDGEVFFSTVAPCSEDKMRLRLRVQRPTIELAFCRDGNWRQAQAHGGRFG